ncbi:MAG TPA: hypothetical protein DGD08_08405 [Gemmatimonas aurantiaca]|uniref:Uncharacterized protein n=1 Tax=Gemmatimonas aurantiaca TaxID=173480 RepID=A0A3D4V7U7_9BACT|nr:hypothetical protein [Gemmatimonas aurantiaca]
MNPLIKPERAALLETVTFAVGGHARAQDAYCVMEAVAYIAGEPWSDQPQCVSPVIAAFCRNWNDNLPEPPRTELLRPLVPLLMGTRTTEGDEQTRAWMATDWLARVQTPAWLRLAGLTAEAQAIEACARIVDATTARAAQPALDDARTKAAAARAAARAAAWDAAWDAARAAAGAAAGAAARDAACQKLAPTVTELQASAVELIRAMCEVGRAS